VKCCRNKEWHDDEKMLKLKATKESCSDEEMLMLETIEENWHEKNERLINECNYG
jgi:hypothetical protein